MSENNLQSRPARLVEIIDRLMPGLWSRLDKSRSKISSRPADVILPSWAVEEPPRPLRLGPGDPNHLTPAQIGINKPELLPRFRAEGFGVDDRVLFLTPNELAMYFAWRSTKMEFRFDADFARELMATPVQGDIPSDILRRLPAGNIYVSVDGSKVLEDCYGIFACLDQPSRGAAPVLNLYFDAGFQWPKLMYTVPLSGANISELIKHRHKPSPREREVVLTQLGHPNPGQAQFPSDEVMHAGHVETLGKVLSLLLYLCSEEPDLSNDYVPVRFRDKVLGTQRRCIAPSQVSIWPVGVRLGALFRKSATDVRSAGEQTEGLSTSVRPHVRRAHWHTYWTGPKATPKAMLRWIAPVIVGARDAGDVLPTAVRPVLPE